MRNSPAAIIVLMLVITGLSSYSQTSGYDTTFRTTYYDQKVSQFRLLPDTRNEIVFLGNSISDIGEWAEIWQNKKVKNRGISGDVTFGVLNRLDEVVSSRPAKVFIMIGINDIAKNVPDSVILSNHKKIVRYIKVQSPRTKIYLQSLLPTNNKFVEFKRHQNKTAHILAVNKGLESLAKVENVVFVNLYPLFLDDNGNLSEKYSNDGLHITGQGYMLWKKFLTDNKYM